MINNIINIGENPIMQTEGLHSLGKKTKIPIINELSEITYFYSVESPDGSIQLLPDLSYYEAQKEAIFARHEVTYVSFLLKDPNIIRDILDSKDYYDQSVATRIEVNKFSRLIDQALLFGKKGTGLLHDNPKVPLTSYGEYHQGFTSYQRMRIIARDTTILANMNINKDGLFTIVESLPPTLVAFRNSSGQISGGQLSWSGAPVVTHNTVEIQVKEDIQSNLVLSDIIDNYISEDKVGIGIFSIESYHK